MNSNPVLSIVIPVYKAETCLNELYRRLKIELEKISSKFEILFIEDCGGDNSWSIICELAKQDPRVKGFQFSRNFGQHYGITAGIDHCIGDWIVVMDCDLQDPPEEISKLYAKAQEGFDIVIARRTERSDTYFKKITSHCFYKIFSYLADLDFDGSFGNFRIFSKKVAANFRLLREELRYFASLVDWLGFRVAYVEVAHSERFEGKSSYTYRKLIKLALDTILASSDKPLKMTVKFGFFVTSLSFLVGLFFLFKALFFGIPVSGWASLIVSIYFLSGIIIATLGMIGVYLGKTFDQTKQRPLYIINHKT